ncbi:GH92 family glycosyl hydrolase [Brachybacterium sp. DNPG3]
MIVTAAPGPIGSPTSADGTGYRAASALRYRFRAGARQRGTLPVLAGLEDLRGRRITRGDVLRTFVHPRLDTALTWGATHVCVDLLLDDGTFLSDHDPRDQHGTRATARGLGAARILHADQWNDVQIPLEAVVGRVVVEVLLVGDAPAPDAASADASAPRAGRAAEVDGWIDGPYLGPGEPEPDPEDLVAWVDTRRGTHSSGDLSRGNTLPITALPNGFAKLTPVTDARTRRWLYEHHRANRVVGGADGRSLPHLQGIALTHQPSPWMGDRGQLVVMPLRGADPDASPVGRAVAFDHAEETARPDRYAVRLADGTRIRVAPTDHGGIIEVVFPPGTRGPHLLIEGVDEHSRIEAAGAVLDGELSGFVDSGPEQGYVRAEGSTRLFLRGRAEPNPVEVGPARGSTPGAALLRFPDGTEQVTLRFATSLIGDTQARRTLQRELRGRSLAQVRAAAHQLWAERLGVLRADGASAPQRRTLYGSLYRLNLYPSSHWEDAGTPQRPQPVHASPVLPTKGEATRIRTNAQIRPGRMYVDHGFWDTYRTAWPAYALLYPELAAELADGFVQQFREGGWIARWSAPGYADCMTGTSSDVAFADLQAQGVTLPDPLSAYLSGLRNATTAPTQSEVGRRGNERAVFTGAVDAEIPESVSWSLEACINDAALAVQAEAIAGAEGTAPALRARLREEAAYLRARSAGYALLFDEGTGFFRGRRADAAADDAVADAWSPDAAAGAGASADFDPLAWGGDYTETNAWTFAFLVPHDPEGLAALHGGREALRERLEEYLATPERADRPGTYDSVLHEMIEAREMRMGQLALSNQPAHHIPFLFHHVGAPERASRIVHEARRRLFVGEQIGQGYPGDEDNGEMSAWWILTALGLYPLQLATGRYHLVAPLFPRAEVRPLGGEAFTIVAETIAADGGDAAAEEDAATDGEERIEDPDDRRILGLEVGGREHRSSAIDRSALRGEVRVRVGTVAQDAGRWGEVPSSPTPPGGRPRPLRDLLGADPSDPLRDDDSRTERTWPGASAVIGLPVLEEPATARFLTLTSGSVVGGDPVAWRLEGSDDGASWRVLDERDGQEFPWRRQTRPFAIARPSACRHHRLVVTAADGPLRLAEVELLA